jgi:L-lactate dehydrogenase (cytochrome)
MLKNTSTYDNISAYMSSNKRIVPRRLRRVFNLYSLEGVARRYLPVPIFDYIAGVAENGRTYNHNQQDLASIGFIPRTLQGHAGRDQSVTIFRKRYARPFGISPMGLSALAAYDGDVVLAQAARDRQTIAIMSATSLTPLERVAKEAECRWFQAYFPGSFDRVVALTDRVAAAGYDTLVVTVDVAANGNRELDLRNGFVTPMALTPKLAWQGITRPSWLCGTAFRTLVARGMPHFENLDTDRGPPIIAKNLIRSFSDRGLLNWEHVEKARERWKGNFVLKGILSPSDTEQARKIGCDGLIVSNHGGRQLDGAISTIDALPGVLAEAGDMTIMLDSGLRRGTDILKAIGMGVSFCFVGRPMLYAAAVSGAAGVRYAIDTLSLEIDRDMALLGIAELTEMSGELLVKHSTSRAHS